MNMITCKRRESCSTKRRSQADASKSVFATSDFGFPSELHRLVDISETLSEMTPLDLSIQKSIVPNTVELSTSLEKINNGPCATTGDSERPLDLRINAKKICELCKQDSDCHHSDKIKAGEFLRNLGLRELEASKETTDNGLPGKFLKVFLLIKHS